MDEKERRIIDYLAGVTATNNGSVPKDYVGGTPNSTQRPSGQYESYWVLSESERAKGFVRPVRGSYKHVGIAGPQHPLRDLTDEEKSSYGDTDWVKFEIYPEGAQSIGRFWSQADLDRVGKGCRTVTSMGRAIAETYARSPGYYGSTFCAGCGTHPPVGEDGEFIWDDGSNERVGT